MMERNGLDCLLIAGSHAVWDRGFTNIRYLANHMGTMEMNTYLVLPLNGEPTLYMLYLNRDLPDRVSRSIINDVRTYTRGESVPALIAKRIRELKLENKRIGLVAFDEFNLIPSDHLQSFKKLLPKAEFEFVTDKFYEVRILKSREEIEWMEKSALLGDLGIETLAKKARDGVTEMELFGEMCKALYSEGAEYPSMLLMGSTSMNDPDCYMPRNRPLPRKIGRGWTILSEIGPRWNEAEAQTGKPITLGEPTEEYKEIFEIGFQYEKKLASEFRAGRTSQEIIQSLEPLKEINNGWHVRVACHGVHGGVPFDGALFSNASVVKKIPLTLKENMVWCPEIFVHNDSGTRGWATFVDTYVVTDGAPRRLNKLPMSLITV